MPKIDKYKDERTQKLLKTIYDACVEEDEAVRFRQLRQYRRLKLLWDGFSQIWYSETAHDWRVYDFNDGETGDGTDQEYYDKPVNVFKGYLETIIAALSVTVPPIKCYPDDADNHLDIITAKTGDKICQLVYRHNDVALLWLHGLFIHMTEGMVAFRCDANSNTEFGTYKEEEWRKYEEERQIVACSLCGFEIDTREADPMTMMSEEMGEFAPGNDDAPLHAEMYEGGELCPACMQMMDPEITTQKFITTRLVGITDEPKSRIILEAYGGLNIRIPNYARKQKECPYLIYSWERNYVDAMHEFKDLRGNKKLTEAMKNPNVAGGYELYDQWARMNPEYMGAYPINVVTQNEAWLRPSSFNFLGNEEDIDYMYKLFPDGAKVIFINDEFAISENSALDDNWTLTENPLADYLMFNPIGSQLTSVQEITNDLISLILQTIEHGIGQTFADQAVVDFNAYGQTETTPGGMFPVTPKSGKSLNDSFFQVKTANLSQEVMPFYQQIQSSGQFVSGALPSLFGGAIEGSETASQYSMSRAQSMQRLQNTWKLFTATWKRLYSKVVPLYIKTVPHDNNFVTKNRDGSFINTFIRRAEMDGRIGSIELEANENLPMTWAQKKDLLLQLMGMTNPGIMAILNAPENLPVIHEALGLDNFVVPGEEDVIKCYESIRLLLQSEPMPTGDEEIPEISSVDVDPDFDNHAIIFDVIRRWAVSEEGQIAKMDNPDGYKNVLLYGKAALTMIQNAQAMEQEQAKLSEGAPPNKKPNPKDKEAPITGDSDVATV